MRKHNFVLLVLALSVLMAVSASATVIDEFLNAPSSPGSGLSGKFIITPSAPTWAFGVGNDAIQDTSISGLSSSTINGLKASDHWVSALISKDAWTDADGDGLGFNFNSIFPIGSVKPSAFDINTKFVPWQWGSADYVAYYWLSNQAGVPGAILNTGTAYDSFNFFAASPASPFVTWTQGANGFEINASGETTLTGPGAPPQSAPEPATAVLLVLGLSLVASRRP